MVISTASPRARADSFTLLAAQPSEASWTRLPTDWYGAIARQEGDGWRATTVLGQPAPTRLGPILWRILRQDCGGEVETFLDEATEPLRRVDCVCDPAIPFASCTCGSVAISERATWMLEQGGCSEKCIPRVLRFLYVFSEDFLSVLGTGCFTSGPGLFWRGSHYRHVPIGLAPLKGPEPDWRRMEERLREIKRGPGRARNRESSEE